MEEKINTLLADTPEGLQPLTEMNAPNTPLIIHEGPYKLVSNTTTYECIGKLEFCWMPSLHVRLSGRIPVNQDLFNDYKANISLNILIDELIVGKCFLINISTSNNTQEATIQGQVDGEIVLGNKSIAVDSVRFEIPNLRGMFGESIQLGTTLSRSRLTIDDDKYLINIDKLIDFKARDILLQEEGGFLLTYTGSLIKKTKSITYEEVGKIMRVFHYFLSFINGLRTSPVIIKGIANGNPVWTMYESPKVDSFKTVWSWIPKFKIESLPTLWANFSKLLKIEGDNDWLTTAIHWYMEANRQAGYAEGSIIIVQCALELLYNRVIIEDKKILKGGDALKLDASNKIRLLLSSLGISPEIPSQLSNTINFISNTSSFSKIDGPGIIVDIRNAFVHGQEEKRKKLKAIPGVVIVEVLHLGIHYIELVLLKLLGYKGPYFNRCIEVTYKA